LLGGKLRGHKIASENTAIIPGRKYYIVIAVARSNSISVNAKGKNQVDLNIKGEASSISSGLVSVSENTSRKSELRFEGNKKLAFGLELSELTYDAQYQRLRLDPITESYRVRGKKDALRTRKVIKSSFIGDPNDGDMFIEIV
jgi:hypothetical protein